VLNFQAQVKTYFFYWVFFQYFSLSKGSYFLAGKGRWSLWFLRNLLLGAFTTTYLGITLHWMSIRSTPSFLITIGLTMETHKIFILCLAFGSNWHNIQFVFTVVMNIKVCQVIYFRSFGSRLDRSNISTN